MRELIYIIHVMYITNLFIQFFFDESFCSVMCREFSSIVKSVPWFKKGWDTLQ